MSDAYSLRLELAAPDARGTTLLRPAVEEVVSWLKESLRKRPDAVPSLGQSPYYGTYEDDSGGSFEIDGEATDPWDYWRLRWDRPGRAGQLLRWIMDVSLATIGDSVEFEVLVRSASDTNAIARVRPIESPPGVVARVLKSFEARVFNWPIDTEVSWIEPQNVHRLINEVLLNPNRTVPVVVLSLDPNTRQYATEPSELARRLSGLAAVFAFSDSPTTFTFGDTLGRQLLALMVHAVSIGLASTRLSTCHRGTRIG